MEKISTGQAYDMYAEEDHNTWAILLQRQSELHSKGKVSREYLNGLDKLRINKHRIVKITEVGDALKEVSGWSLIPVNGLIPNRDFFYMLINKKYPVTVYMRKPSELEFSEQPDIFHDVCGHLPLLVNEKFTRFLTAYSAIALKYINNERAIDLLGRLYWFTYEMGLIIEDGQFRAYGGAIITSSGEFENIEREEIPKYDFDLHRIFKTPYNSFKLQREYFFIHSFDDLFNCLEDIEEKLIEHLLLPDEDHTLRNFFINSNINGVG
ncbi:phenylalanine-4-hydroxylase [Puia dinghuensis]|uniref:Biopterin-dependent aromatic amino acid hydroxylase family profile domain-containing protein n=1 Tax=Puia dinghuensis TaxID=1792502 RepID=A0A8J2XPL9_9BACT|nr:phenylalanine-4-hydroxylase [Puia dinghuensis]GGA81204.1 hypothetical protein GCM10011511_00210 [Puia dinghuensis]